MIEYVVDKRKHESEDSLEDYLNQRGEHGWELVEIKEIDYGVRLIFKRPKVSNLM